MNLAIPFVLSDCAMNLAPHSPPPRSYIADIARAFTIGVLNLTVIVGAVIVLYAVKSKLGINLLQEPSPLHGVFVTMRNAGLV